MKEQPHPPTLIGKAPGDRLRLLIGSFPTTLQEVYLFSVQAVAFKNKPSVVDSGVGSEKIPVLLLSEKIAEILDRGGYDDRIVDGVVEMKDVDAVEGQEYPDGFGKRTTERLGL